MTSISVEGVHATKSLSEIVEELKVKVLRGEPMTDWYLSWLAFTKLCIENVSLGCYLHLTAT